MYIFIKMIFQSLLLLVNHDGGDISYSFEGCIDINVRGLSGKHGANEVAVANVYRIIATMGLELGGSWPLNPSLRCNCCTMWWLCMYQGEIMG